MSLESLLKGSKPILFDGGMGTEIIKRGLKLGKIPDLLNLEQPDVIVEILSKYFDAGADMVQTCTFSSNLENFKSNNIGHMLEEVNFHALQNILKARKSNALIIGDIGPSGKYRPPVGNITEEQWYNGFKRQVQVLSPEVDAWHVETMTDIKEMESAIHAIKDISKKPIMASMTYRMTKKKGFYTIMGDSLETCVNSLENEGVDVIGTNCTLNSSEMIDLASELVEMTSRPVLVKPNAGQPRLEGVNTFYDQNPDDFIQDINKMIENGVRIVGGCCGTTPAHITKLRTLIDTL